jgi:FkbM family methyltransferase
MGSSIKIVRLMSLVLLSVRVVSVMHAERTHSVSRCCAEQNISQGFCGVTNVEDGVGDCSSGSKGRWQLNVKSAAAAEAQCFVLCKSCARCRYFSYSHLHQDCSWFHNCATWPSDLLTTVSSFSTVSMTGSHRSLGTYEAALRTAVACNDKHSRAQYGEDAVLLSLSLLLLHDSRANASAPLDPSKAFFEMGAFDGLTYSNTFALEQCLGWNGLLVEGNPLNFANLSVNRPGNILRQTSVCEHEGAVQMTLFGDEVASNPALEPEAHRKQFGKSFGRGVRRHGDKLGEAEQVVRVPCKPLRTLFAELHITRLAIFSLDVEGAELSVLQTIDWTAVHIDVLMVELDGHFFGQQSRDDDVRRLLSQPETGMCRLPTSWEYRHSDIWLRRATLGWVCKLCTLMEGDVPDGSGGSSMWHKSYGDAGELWSRCFRAASTMRRCCKSVEDCRGCIV